MYTFLLNTHAKLRIGQKRGIRRSVRIIMYTILQHFLGSLKFNYVGFMGSFTGCFLFWEPSRELFSVNKPELHLVNMTSVSAPSKRWLTEFFRTCHLQSIQTEMLSVKVDWNPILSIQDLVNRGPTNLT